jgi:multidrug resistance protein MdtO
LGSQILVLPYIDSIVGLTILFAIVTGISAYVATSSPRLSYAGLQMAFAFYLINVTDFSISLDLTIGRDRVIGVLLGIASMWLVFDRLHYRPAGVQMVRIFAQSARLVASLKPASRDESEINRVGPIREEIDSLFTNVNAEADAVLFESGPQRASQLAARDRVRRWLTALRTIYLLELPLLEFRSTLELDRMHQAFRGTEVQLFEAVSTSLVRIAERLESEVREASHTNSGIETILTRAPLGEDSESSTAEEPLLKLAKLIAHLTSKLQAEVFKERVFAS